MQEVRGDFLGVVGVSVFGQRVYCWHVPCEKVVELVAC